MSDNTSNDRLIENEKIIQSKNQAAGKSIKTLLRDDKDSMNEPIAFICECSDLNCKEPVNVSIKDYEKFHTRKDQFTISRGHATPTVEQIVAKYRDFSVVEKYALDP